MMPAIVARVAAQVGRRLACAWGMRTQVGALVDASAQMGV